MRRQKQLFFWAVILTAVFLFAACGGGESQAVEVAPRSAGAGDVEAGKTFYGQTCSACHGPEALGVQGLGKDLTTSTFVHDVTDEQFLEFLKTGRPASHPENSTGIDMPPKGGNPALNDAQLMDIIAFIRSVNH